MKKTIVDYLHLLYWMPKLILLTIILFGLMDCGTLKLCYYLQEQIESHPDLFLYFL
jgi:hypothetical protein